MGHRRLSVASIVNQSSASSFQSGPPSSPSSMDSPPTTLHDATTSSIIDTHDENVIIAVRALGDMRTGLVGGPSSGPGQARSPRLSSSLSERSTTRDFGWTSSIADTSARPTPSLSIASSSSQTTTPSIMSHPLVDEEIDEIHQIHPHSENGITPDDFVSRVSHLPLVNTALRAYDYSKASSRVVKYGAGLVESSVKSISRPVMDRLPVNQLDEFACRQLDRLEKYTRKPNSPRNSLENDRMELDDTDWGEGRARLRRNRQSSSTSSMTSVDKDGRRHTAEDDRRDAESTSEQQVSVVTTRSSWQTMLVEAGGIGAAVSEESMKRLKYCLEWLQYATARIDQQIVVLRQFLSSIDSSLSNDPDAVVPASTMITLTDVKRDVVATVRQVVEVMTKYAGGALPEPARASVRAFILILPERWANAMQQHQPPGQPGHSSAAQVSSPGGSSSSHGGISSTPTALAVQQAAHKVLTLANESLDMLRGVTGVFKESLDRAEAWVERLRIIGIQRQRQQREAAAGRLYPPPTSEVESTQGWLTAPNSPGVDLQGLSIDSVYGTPASSSIFSRRLSESDHGHDRSDSDTETDGGDSRNGVTLRRRQRRKLSASDDISNGKPVVGNDP